MEDGIRAHLNIEEAQKLLNDIKLTEDNDQLLRFNTIVKKSIEELISTSHPKSPNPAILKVLNDASSLVDDKLIPNNPKGSFAFKSPNKFKSEEVCVSKAVPAVNIDVVSSNEPMLKFGKHYVIKNQTDLRIARMEVDVVGSVILENLNNCEIVLLNVVESVYISNVTNSLIWISTIKSSAIIDTIKDTKMITACRQLRIASGYNCRFYVHTVTKPIIELSSEISFSGNHLCYENYEDHLKTSGLDGLVKNDTVVDFSCHYINKTPNWHILEDNVEYKISISNEVDAHNNIKLNDNDWLMLKSL